jgi:hypothetical protein
MPTPTIPAGNLFMNATLYTGTGVGSRVITNGVAGASFQPDFVWLKDRTSAYSNQTNDSVRGATNGCLYTDLTNAVDANFGITSFNSNGFTLGNTASLISQSFVSQNGTGDNYVAWQWKAGGTAVTNTSGTISSQVSANTTSGFSVVTYSGNSTSGATVGHGLGVAPAMMIVKNRSGSNFWVVQHQSLSVITNNLYLNATDGQQSDSQFTSKSATTVTLRDGGSVNTSGNNYVMYAWAQIAGYSAFGSYTGNGSADGPFIYTGFRPKFVMFKGSSIASNWCMLDSSRNTYNLTDATLQANSSAAELTNLSDVDFLSNGIKIRDVVTNDTNVSGQTYIYAAFAENPFKYSNAR